MERWDLESKYFLTTPEVAIMLRTTADTLRKRMEKGQYNGLYHKEGKFNLWHKAKLFQYLGIVA